MNGLFPRTIMDSEVRCSRSKVSEHMVRRIYALHGSACTNEASCIPAFDNGTPQHSSFNLMVHSTA